MTKEPSQKTDYVPPPNILIAKLLGWIPTPLAPCRLCAGYFLQPSSIQSQPAPPSYKKLPTQITAEGPAVFSIKGGTSVLEGPVQISQTGRLITADQATLYRDKVTGKITHVQLTGQVNFQEYGKQLISQTAFFNPEEQTAELTRVLYRILQSDCDSYSGRVDGWGTAKSAQRLSDGTLVFNQATYSTCSPLRPNWQISAKQIVIHHNKKRGIAKNAVLRIKNIPILYSPYLSFSVNKTRQTGFLTPEFSNSTDDGFSVGIPYYWNIAPNLDLLLTPVYYSKRGFQLNGLFRYLTQSSRGDLQISYLPDDQEFTKFKNETIASYSSSSSSQLQPYLDQLERDGSDRAYFSFYNYSVLGNNWTTEAILNYVSDAYYLRDFGVTANQVNSNQLLNQFDLRYSGEHWQAVFLTQAYQTLHLIDQATNPTVNQYMRLPELDAVGNYPEIAPNLDLNLNMQAVNFAYQSDFPPLTDELPVGQRFHFQPVLTYSFAKPGGYITPSLLIDSTVYNISRPDPGQAAESSRNLPIASIDSGLYYDRRFQWGHRQYIQTLEPRLFYLYTPLVNQDKYPVFDTQELPFTFEQLFSINRFTGIDRIQNANQVSFGITSRVLDQDDAFQVLKANLGIGYSITPPQICLTTNCPPDNRHWTPLAAELTYFPFSHWSINGGVAWDPVLNQINNAQIEGDYNLLGRYIVGASYIFVHEDATTSPSYITDNTVTDSSAITEFHVAWPFSSHWSTLGYLYYNVTNRHPESYFVGLQYDTCCLSLRFIVNRLYLGSTPNSSATASSNQYSTHYVLQLQLKGLGSAANSNPHTLLTSSIPGFEDPFS